MAEAALFSPLGLLGLGSPAMLMSVWKKEAESNAGRTAGCPHTYHRRHVCSTSSTYTMHAWTFFTPTANSSLHTRHIPAHYTAVPVYRHIHSDTRARAHTSLTHMHSEVYS